MGNTTIKLSNTPRRESPRFYAERIANAGTVYHVGLSRQLWKTFYRLNRISRWEGARYIRDVEPDARRALYYALSCTDGIDWLAIRAHLKHSGNALSRARAFRNTHGYQ